MTALSGKKERTVICCLTTEVVKVVKPVDFYEATRVFIITHGDENGSPDESGFYDRFLEEACDRINGPDRDIVEVVRANIMDYQDMMRTIIGIIRRERQRSGDFVDIFVNISSGTPEYVAGAMLAAMQDEKIVAFSVRTKSRSMTPEQALEAYTVDGKPVGRTSEVYDPTMVMTFGTDVPDSRLVACLGIINGIDPARFSFKKVIEALRSEGLWDYVPEEGKGRTDESQKERMFLKRNFINPMVESGWIAEDVTGRNRYLLTRKGEAVLNVYGGLP